MKLHDPEHRRQPEPCSFPRVLGGEERLEEPAEVLGRDTAAGVCDADHRVRAWRSAEAVLALDDGLCRGDHESGAAGPHRVTRIERQVDEHLPQHSLIRASDERRAPELDLHEYVVAEEAAQHGRDVGHHAVQIEGRGLEDLAPRERQELLGERRAALGRGDDLAEERAVLHRRSEACHLRLRQDRGEDVVEVVGDASGELADRLHLLRLPEPLRDVLLLRDVDDRAGHVGRLAQPIAIDAATARQPADGAVRPHDAVLDHVVARAALERALDLRRDDRAIVLMDQRDVVGKAPREPTRFDAEHAHDAVRPVDDAARDVPSPRPHLRRLQGEREVRSAHGLRRAGEARLAGPCDEKQPRHSRDADVDLHLAHRIGEVPVREVGADAPGHDRRAHRGAERDHRRRHRAHAEAKRGPGHETEQHVLSRTEGAFDGPGKRDEPHAGAPRDAEEQGLYAA